MSSFSGLFWLSEQKDSAVRGHLTIDAGESPRLSLVEPLTSAWKVVKQTQDENGYVTTEYGVADDVENFILHGILEDSPRFVSLVDCTTISRKEINTGKGTFQEQVLEARYLIRGAHISGKEQGYSGLKVRVSNIDAWASLPGFKLSWSPESPTSELSYEPANISAAETDSGVSLSVSEEIRRPMPRVTGGSLSRKVWVKASGFDEKTTFDELGQRYVTPIVTYLNLLIGRPSPLCSMRLQLGPGEVWVQVFHSNMASDDLGQDVPRRSILISLRDVSLECLCRFIDMTRDVGSFAPVVADAYSSLRRATLETQVLELTTVAEGIHRSLYQEDFRVAATDANRIRESVFEALAAESQRHKDIVRGFLRYLEEPNYKTRIRRLANEVGVAMPEAIGDTEAWIGHVDRARNLFAHRTNGHLDESLVDEFYAVSQSLRWVLAGILLLSSGIDKDVLSQKLNESQRYGQFIRNMRSHLPSVYHNNA